ncbi:MAG: hypothetical protein KA028_00480 [Candidatus Pacebacteria bacterium]|nr:hypothetical protein [Candidatus Paceibacterota bacterium]MBP9852089.1 hypothetical protein [Candidatus Paceibacterota bacterium]
MATEETTPPCQSKLDMCTSFKILIAKICEENNEQIKNKQVQQALGDIFTDIFKRFDSSTSFAEAITDLLNQLKKETQNAIKACVDSTKEEFGDFISNQFFIAAGSITITKPYATADFSRYRKDVGYILIETYFRSMRDAASAQIEYDKAKTARITAGKPYDDLVVPQQRLTRELVTNGLRNDMLQAIEILVDHVRKMRRKSPLRVVKNKGNQLEESIIVSAEQVA